MGSEIGSLAEGKLADLVAFDPGAPGMICGATHDPVAMIVDRPRVFVCVKNALISESTSMLKGESHLSWYIGRSGDITIHS